MYVAIRHNIIEEIIYKMDNIIFFDRNKSTTSYEKAEKVVKEPKNPIIKKYFIKLSDKFFV